MKDVMRRDSMPLPPGDVGERVAMMKDMGNLMHTKMDEYAHIGGARELALAKTKLEEAVMWAVKGITA